MPDKDGKLSAEETQKARDWLFAHAKSGCPGCGQLKWTLAPHLVNILVYTPGAFRIGGPSYPALLMVCHECGCFRLHSAILAGISLTASETSQQEVKSGT